MKNYLVLLQNKVYLKDWIWIHVIYTCISITSSQENHCFALLLFSQCSTLVQSLDAEGSGLAELKSSRHNDAAQQILLHFYCLFSRTFYFQKFTI